MHWTDIRRARLLGGVVQMAHWGIFMRSHSRNILLTAAALGTLACAAVSQARDLGQYSQVPHEIRTWVESLADGKGVPCCATADGAVPEEFTWDMGANHYRVKVYGQWVTVPDAAVIKGPNRLGHAVVWIAYDDPVFETKPILSVRCFLPGPGA
jgi:hypothetical protein